MRRFTNPLKHVTVAAPCPADWDSMIGNDRVRFCGQCELNVFNLSAMSRDEAESLIAGSEGRLCVRFYRRKDGSIITQDCPVGLRSLKRRAARIKRVVAASILGFLTGVGVNAASIRLGWLPNSPALWGRHEPRMGVMVAPEHLQGRQPVSVERIVDNVGNTRVKRRFQR